MPEIKLIDLKECTSQDDKHPAENLLNGQVSGGKWLTASSKTTTMMSATFQLSKSSPISSVHIGNSGSAFITLYVSRLGSYDFQTLLPCSALMSAQESKMGQNKTCVKIFEKNDFLEETKSKKWGQIKVVLTQPFNIQAQFGLCFMRIFSFLEEDNMKSTINSDLISKWEKIRSESCYTSSPQSSKNAGQLLQSISPSGRGKKLRHIANEKVKINEQNIGDSGSDDDDLDESHFIAVILNFMESLKLKDNDMDNIHLIDIRKKLEKNLGKQLSPEKKRIFINTVQKYVVSLNSKNLKDKSMVKTPNLISDIKDKNSHFVNSFQSSRENKSHVTRVSHSIKNNQNMVNKSGCNSKVEWLCSVKELPSTSKHSDSDQESPNLRRNIISMEDCDLTSECETENSDKVSKVVLQNRYFNKKQKLKRKVFEGDKSNKHCKVDGVVCAVNRSSDNSEDIAIVKTLYSDRQETQKEDKLIQCPICKVYFEASYIENHSSSCVTFIDIGTAEETLTIKPEVECPICTKKMSSSVVDMHAARCASEIFGD